MRVVSKHRTSSGTGSLAWGVIPQVSASVVVTVTRNVRSKTMNKKHTHPRDRIKQYQTVDEKIASAKVHRVSGSNTGRENWKAGMAPPISDTKEPFAGWIGYVPESAEGDPVKIKLWKEYVKREQELWRAEMKSERRENLFGRSWVAAAKSQRSR